MNFNHDAGSVTSLLTIDTTQAPPLGGRDTLQIVGTGGLAIPSGTTAERPTGVPAGTQRWNTTIGAVETFNGTTWATDSGGTVTSVTVESANAALDVTNPTVTGSGTITVTAHQELVNLTGIDTNAEGPVVRQTNGTYITRELVGTAPVTVTNGDGVAGNPTVSVNDELVGLSELNAVGLVYHAGVGQYVEKTLAVSGDLTINNGETTITIGYEASGNTAGLDAMAGTGVVVRTDATTGAEVYATRALEGVAGRTDVSNGDFVAGNAVVDLATVSQADSGDFVKVTLDAYGRVTGNTAVVTSDITDLVDSVYVNADGDTMTGNLAFGGTATVIGLTTPVNSGDAATKGYVDALVSGLKWLPPVNEIAVSEPTTPVVGDRYINTTDNKVYTFTSNGWDSVTPTDGTAAFDKSSDTGYVFTGTEWVQFTGTGQVTAGVGMAKSGNTLNVNMGAGIAQLPTDEVGVDIYAGSALFLTADGTTATTDTAAQLALRVGGGLAQDSVNGVHIPNDGVTNAMLVNDKVEFYGNSGVGDITLGGSIGVVGSGAIHSDFTGTEIQLTVDVATDGIQGVAAFSADHFAVSGGNVTLAADLEDLLNVDTASKNTGDLLSWDEGTSKWVPIAQDTVAPDLALDDLTDVTVIAPLANTDILQFVGTGWENRALGAASGVQPHDAGLDSLSSLSSTGIVVSTANNTFATRALTAGTGIDISGNITTGDLTIANTGVTSVGLDLPSIFSVTGSPVTTTGTLTATLNTVPANQVFAGPASGADAGPAFRALTPADVGLELYKENGVSAVAPTATGNNALALGSGATATRTGELAHASGVFSASGDAQSIEMVVRGSTTNSTAVELTAGGDRAVLDNDAAWTFTVQVIGLRTDGAAAAGYRFDGVIYRGATASSIAFIGTPSKNILGETSFAYDAAVVADAATGALRVDVTGPDSATVRWVATIRATQVKA